MPMVKNMKNHRDWPKVVSQDVIQQFQSFSSNVSLFVSQTKGTTVLPVPDLQEVNIETASEDRTLIHSLETTIINWTREIKVGAFCHPPNLLPFQYFLASCTPANSLYFFVFFSDNESSPMHHHPPNHTPTHPNVTENRKQSTTVQKRHSRLQRTMANFLDLVSSSTSGRQRRATCAYCCNSSKIRSC